MQSDYIEAGDIGAAVGFKSIKTGDTLSDEKASNCIRIYGLSRSSNWYCG